MSDRPPCVHASSPRHFVAGPLALSLALALTASGCSPEPTPGSDGGTTSKVPEIARRQKHMQDMLKKGESKATSPPESH